MDNIKTKHIRRESTHYNRPVTDLCGPDYVASITLAIRGGESIASILENIGSVFAVEMETIPRAASESKKDMKSIVALLDKAHRIARKADM